MKTLLKILKWAIPVLILIVIAGVAFLKLALPNVEAPKDLEVELTQERIHRGQYLANHVNLCMDCHSKRDFTVYTGPPSPGTEGAGGDVFNHDMGFPGTFYSRNITPHGLSDWSDGEIYRAITSGVDKQNEVIFPVMPWQYYNKMATEDVYSIIAYLRSLSPVESVNKVSSTDFPVSLIKNTFPVEANPTPLPDKSDVVAYGSYITNAAGCIECHSKKDAMGKNIPGTEFGGGMAFKLPGLGTVYSANISPDPETGMKHSKDGFIALFKMYSDSTYTPHSIEKGSMQTMMPWMMYSGMTEEDLGAIYEYLKTVTPIQNEVAVKFEAELASN
ncbi:cytochrome c [Jiulongibacter sp. NS-SX5]|uniref:cytochrome c n=1 Tax=Jiulongibacter sp. NS-SX5 TaxID=3463854 RepID=UPI0040598E68